MSMVTTRAPSAAPYGPSSSVPFYLTPAAFLCAWVLLGLLCGIGIFTGFHELMLLAGILAIPVGLVLLAWPDVATLGVLFVLYTNAAVVAVRFHGVPYAVGLCVPLLLAVPVARYVIGSREKIVFTPTLPLVALFVLAQLYSSMFSANPDLSMNVLTGSLVEGLGLFFLLTNVVRTPRLLRLATWVLLAAGAFMGGLSAIQQATGNYDKNYGGFAQMSNAEFETGEQDPEMAHQRRLAGPLGDQNRYAQIMLMLIPLGMFLSWGESDRRLRYVAMVATGLTAVGLCLAFSRGAAVAFVLMLLTMVLLRYITWRQFLTVGLGLGLVAVVVPQYGARLVSLEKLAEAVDEDGAGINAADGAVRSRYTEMMAAFLMFNDHPFTGVGPGMYPVNYRPYAERVAISVKETARQPHTLLLGIAAELGLPGLIAFSTMILASLLALARARRMCLTDAPEQAHIVAGFMLAIVGYMATALFLHFAYVRYFWLMLALAEAAAVIARRECLLAKWHRTLSPERGLTTE